MRFVDRHGHTLPLSVVFGNHLADVRRRQAQREATAEKLRNDQSIGIVTHRTAIGSSAWRGDAPSGMALSHCVDDSAEGDNALAPKD